MPPQGTQQQDRGVKRKKPPTFQHLPADRAKKLKRSWVDVQKIKSKWKAQKRKEGLIAPRSRLEGMVGTAEGEGGQEDDEEANEAISAPSHAKSAAGGSSEEGSGDENPREKEEEQPSLRELQRMAYSKSSLHNHKSRPLNNRHKGPAATEGRSGGRGGSNHRGASRGQGRGQPDMGLRMKAMLEKIKQDLS
ncbi:hypothetical protein C8Q78DRAFT_975281 [Trametes maxima]|nr:hypothetical protein C8Q78DRAFT_975281 [Trametes maxima]